MITHSDPVPLNARTVHLHPLCPASAMSIDYWSTYAKHPKVLTELPALLQFFFTWSVTFFLQLTNFRVFFLKNKNYIYVCYICVGAHRIRKGSSGSLKVKLQAGIKCLMCEHPIEPESSARAVSTFKCGAILLPSSNSPFRFQFLRS